MKLIRFFILKTNKSFEIGFEFLQESLPIWDVLRHYTNWKSVLLNPFPTSRYLDIGKTTACSAWIKIYRTFCIKPRSSTFEAATPINDSDLSSLRREVLTLILLASALEVSLYTRMKKIKVIGTDKKNCD